MAATTDNRTTARGVERLGECGASRVLLAGAGVLYLGVFAPTFIWFWRRWTHSIWDDSHGLVVPFACGYLCWRILRREGDGRPTDPSAWGFVFLGAGLGLAVCEAAVRGAYLGALGFLVTLPGLALLLLGRHRTRAIALPLAVSWLMLPVPTDMLLKLQLRQLTATGVEPLLRLIGIPTLRDGTLIEIPGYVFLVAGACSGFSTLYATLAVAAVLSVLSRSTTRRLLILVAAPVLAIGANVIRVMGLILLTREQGSEILDSVWHPVSGLVTFALVLAVLFAIDGSALRRRSSPP